MSLVQVVINYLISSIVTVTITVLATLIIQAYLKPYPLTKLDHFIRVHFRKRKINGQDLVFFKQIDLSSTSVTEVLDFIKRDTKSENFHKLKSLGLNGIDIENIYSVETKVDHKIQADLKINKLNGKFELSLVKTELNYSNDYYDDNVKAEISLKFESWTYKDVSNILHDASALIDKICDMLGEEYEYTKGASVVEFKTGEPPAVLDYINKLSTNKSENKFSLVLSNNLTIYFLKEECKFVGVNSTADYNLILDAISWYV